MERALIHALVDARDRSALKLGAVARSMGAPASAVARLESGGHNPTLKTIARYAAAVGAKIVVKPPKRVPKDWMRLKDLR